MEEILIKIKLKKQISPKTILRKMVNQALQARVIDSMRPKVGKFVMRLSDEEREILRELKSDDIKNAGLPRYNIPT